MRFLCTDLENGFRLKEFNHLTTKRQYTILSHRWGVKEVLLRDLMSLSHNTEVEDADGDMSSENSEDGDASSEDSDGLCTVPEDADSEDGDMDEPGSSDGIQFEELKRWCKIVPPNWKQFKKLIGCCWRARKDGYKYVWIDTCCIDQKSSAELSESINSMYSLYANAAICYAYLRDVRSTTDPQSPDSVFRKSTWFKRGWTLQEMIAPHRVVFLTRTWGVIGSKNVLARTIQEITKIDYGVLSGWARVEDMSIAERMSWASNRDTTKIEDRAYSLLGIFGVNMTTIYGEGDKAFHRLQHEIIGRSTDHSIFAWGLGSSDLGMRSRDLIASSPAAFSDLPSILTIPHIQFTHQWGHKGIVAGPQITTIGVLLELPVARLQDNICVVALACNRPDPYSSSGACSTVGLVLRLESEGYHIKLGHINCIDQVARLGVQFKFEQICVRGSSTPTTIDDRALSSNLAQVPQTYQIVLKALTLIRLRDDHGIELDDQDVEVKWMFRIGQGFWAPDDVGLPVQYTCRWVESSTIRGRDFLITVQCEPDIQLPAGNVTDSGHQFFINWKWRGGQTSLTFFINARNPCAHLELGSINDDPVFKSMQHWSVKWGDKTDGDAVLTRTNIMTEMVFYELDLMINAERHTNVLPVPDKSQFSKQLTPGKLPVEPVEWIPACLGITPKDVNELHDAFRGTGYLVRARHGMHIITPGFLERGSLYATGFTLSDSFEFHHDQAVYEYEVLVGSSSLLRWVPARGRFSLDALRGAKPVEGGVDTHEQTLYLIRAHVKDLERYEYSEHNDTLGDTSGPEIIRNENQEEPISPFLTSAQVWYGAVSVGQLPLLGSDHWPRYSKKYSVLVHK